MLKIFKEKHEILFFDIEILFFDIEVAQEKGLVFSFDHH